MATEYDIEANTVLYFLDTSPLLGDNEKKIRLSKNVDNYEIEYHDSEVIIVRICFVNFRP